MSRSHRSARLGMRAVACLTLLLVVATLVPAVPAAAAGVVVWVGPGGSDTTGTGTRSAPYRTITEALGHVGAGDTVNVLPGTYDTPAGESFPLAPGDGVWVRGIGPGKPRVVGAGQDSVFTIQDRSARISGLEITGGGSTSPAAFGSGVAIGNTLPSSAIVIEDCWIHGNSTLDAGGSGYGGGVAAMGPAAAVGSLTVRKCRIEGNTAHGDGGGIYAFGFATVTIDDCIVTGNRADDSAGNGGGIAVSRAASLTISECEITFNTAGDGASGYAGGVHTYLSSGTLSDLLVTWNVAPSSPVAAQFDQGSLELHNCTFADNHVTPANPGATHAVVFTTGGTYEMHSCAVWGNSPALVSHDGLTTDKLCTDDSSFHDPPDIKRDPLFVNPSSQGPNYRLFRDSWCIDILASEQLGGTDLDGRPRISNGNSLDPAEIDIGPYEAMLGVTRRLWGADRYGTANALWTATMKRANSAVIATGVTFPDALAAGALAGAVEGPLLLVKKTAIPPGVIETLRGMGVTGIYLVGGTDTISSGVKSQLEGLGFNVVRIAGADRYATSAQVAFEVQRLMGDRYQNTVIVARGDDFPDALASSPWAYAEGIPVLLTQPTALPSVTASAASSCGKSGVYIVGGTNAVSAGVASAIDAASMATPRRIAGADRYATAAAVAYACTGLGPNGVDDPVLGWHEVGLATGSLFPDALTGGAACGAQRGVILLLTRQSASSPTADALHDQRRKVYRLSAFGGPVVMSDIAIRAAGSEVNEPYW